MQIVIDMPDADFDLLKSLTRLHKPNFWERAILNGTVLPEHHGRLIDADSVYKTVKPIEPNDAEWGMTAETAIRLIHDAFDRASTIIPATETKEPTRTMLDCYKCKNNKAEISCEECHFEPAVKEKSCKDCKYQSFREAYSCVETPCNACYESSHFAAKEGDAE